MKIALVQMRSEKADIQGNLAHMEHCLNACVEEKADIVCFPEMNITGYADPHKYPQVIISREDPAVLQAAAMSKRFGATLVAGFIEQNPRGKPYITQLAARKGHILGFYRKITIEGEEADWFSPGKDLYAFDQDGVRIGITVCADIHDPKLFKGLKSMGASIVLECAAPGLYGSQASRNWLSGYNWWRGECFQKLGTYAAENGFYVLISIQAGRTVDEDFPGGGYAFDPSGQCILESDGWEEGILFAEIPIC